MISQILNTLETRPNHLSKTFYHSWIGHILRHLVPFWNWWSVLCFGTAEGGKRDFIGYGTVQYRTYYFSFPVPGRRRVQYSGWFLTAFFPVDAVPQTLFNYNCLRDLDFEIDSICSAPTALYCPWYLCWLLGLARDHAPVVEPLRHHDFGCNLTRS